MRKICTCLFIFLCSISTCIAQAKIAYINMQQLITSMPEAKAAYDTLQQYQQVLLNDGQALVMEYQKKAAELDSTQSKLSANLREVKLKDLEMMKNNIEEYRQRMEQKLAAREQTLTEPILAKAKKAISDLAAEKGYVCVLDNSKDIVVTATCDDILPAAKLKLGIK